MNCPAYLERDEAAAWRHEIREALNGADHEAIRRLAFMDLPAVRLHFGLRRGEAQEFRRAARAYIIAQWEWEDAP